MPIVAGQNITKKAHDALVEAALREANDRGYCSEVEDMLETLGFDVPPQEATVTLTLRVSDFGRNSDLTRLYAWAVENMDAYDASIEVVSAVVS